MLRAASLRSTSGVIFRMPLKFSAAVDRAEIIPPAVGNEGFSDLLATKLHFAYGIDHSLFSISHDPAFRGGEAFEWIIGQLNACCWQMEHLCSHFPFRAKVVRAPSHPGHSCFLNGGLG
jgi:hypothetical protein